MTLDRKPGLGILTRQIPLAQTYPLRQSVLRPGLPPEAAMFSEDEAPATTHWGAFSPEGKLVAIATLQQAPKPGTTQPSWQVRGMATAPEFRNQGYGSAVLRAVMEWARSERPNRTLWCNARVTALDFYRAHGFETDGVQFEIPSAGPHFVMKRSLK